MIREIKRSSVFQNADRSNTTSANQVFVRLEPKASIYDAYLFPIRNFEYAIADKEFGKHAEHKKQTYWKLRDPLKIKTVVSTGYNIVRHVTYWTKTLLEK